MRRKRGIRKMIIAIIALVVFLGSILIFFSIPYSKTKAKFISVKNILLKDTANHSEIFKEEDIADLPSPVQKYFYHCGYINTPKMYVMKAVYKNVKFIFGKGKPVTIIDYTQYNAINEPARIAYIDSSMYGIPFEGLDSFNSGSGSMKGVLAKLFTLFNQTGETMDKASLVTFLSECLIVPSSALQNYITWEEIDDLHAKATIAYYGKNASGIFTFKENGDLLSFTSDDREAVSTNGKSEKVRWSVVFSDYKKKDDISQPTRFQAIWHYDDGDLIYFDGEDVLIEYDQKLS